MSKEVVKHARRMVEAVELGHCGKKLRHPGEKFEFDGAPAKWFKELGSKAPAEKKPEEGDEAAKAEAAAAAKAAKEAKALEAKAKKEAAAAAKAAKAAKK